MGDGTHKNEHACKPEQSHIQVVMFFTDSRAHPKEPKLHANGTNLHAHRHREQIMKMSKFSIRANLIKFDQICSGAKFAHFRDLFPVKGIAVCMHFGSVLHAVRGAPPLCRGAMFSDRLFVSAGRPPLGPYSWVPSVRWGGGAIHSSHVIHSSHAVHWSHAIHS